MLFLFFKQTLNIPIGKERLLYIRILVMAMTAAVIQDKRVKYQMMSRERVSFLYLIKEIKKQTPKSEDTRGKVWIDNNNTLI